MVNYTNYEIWSVFIFNILILLFGFLNECIEINIHHKIQINHHVCEKKQKNIVNLRNLDIERTINANSVFVLVKFNLSEQQ